MSGHENGAQSAEKDAGCYICQPDNPHAAGEGCGRCGRDFAAAVAAYHAACEFSPDGWCMTHSTGDGPVYCARVFPPEGGAA